MKIGFVTTFDARSVAHWSGTPYFMAKALAAQGAEIDFIGPLAERAATFFKAKQALTNRLRGQNYLRHREPVILRDYARQIARHIERSPCDVVLSPGSVPVSYLECEKPIVIWTDATFARMENFYDNFSRLTPESARDGHAAEQLALNRCRMAIYSSEWAAASAKDDYHAASEKLAVIPFGANVPWRPSSAEIEAVIKKRSAGIRRLLFIGVEWRRKGGPLALSVMRELNRAGRSAELTVIGCAPDAGASRAANVRWLGYIDKGTAAGSRRIYDELARAHFLLLPARADCSPAVLSEANSLAVPVLAPAVGGIPTIVRDGVNGYLLTTNAGADDYGARICSCDNYEDLARSAHHEFKTRLNWQTGAAQLLSRLG